MGIENKFVELDGIKIPYITNEEGDDYYPIKYICKNFLSKALSRLHEDPELKSFTRKYIIDFRFKGTAPQEGYCIRKDGLIQFIKRIKPLRLTEIQVNRYNMLCKHLGFDFVFEYKGGVEIYNEYLQDAINEFKLKNIHITEEKICLKCNRTFPLDINFFYKNERKNDGCVDICKDCYDGNGYIKSINTESERVYKTYGLEGYLMWKHKKLEFICKYQNNDIKTTYDVQDIMDVLKNEYVSGVLNNDTLNLEYISKTYNIKGLYRLNNKVLIEYCTDRKCMITPWKYSGYVPSNPTYEEANIMVKAYIEENLSIDNILEYEGYGEILRICKISKFKNNILYFVVQYYEFKYAGYLFKTKGSNYYKDKNMRILDMKYLVEEDLKVIIPKIPLYITKYLLHQKSKSLYYVLTKYYKNLFEWIDECYPNEFNINDFVNNPFRSEFDSLEEAQVDEEIRNVFKGTIYNCRSREDYVKINGMIPDWIIHTDRGCYLVEYFGLYGQRDISSSSRLIAYKKNTDIKITKYIALEEIGYKHLFIFPSDLKNNFEGLNNKLKNIK